MFSNFEKIYYLLFVAICDMMHDVMAIHGICCLLTVSGNLFCKTSDAREAAISWASLILQKDFQMLLAVKKGEM